MGCSPSTFSFAGRDSVPILVPIMRRTAVLSGGGKGGKRRASTSDSVHSFDVALRQLLRQSPPITIDIDLNVLSVDPQSAGQVVIFVFGGPGSLKGILTQELAEEFDFVTICVEDIVFSNLPHKLGNTTKSTVEMQEMLKRDSNLVNLKWILQMISVKMTMSTSQRFVVDVVPDLTSLLRSSAFSDMREHDQCLEDFDRRHHIMFALDLHLGEDRLIMESKGIEGTSIRSSSSSSLSTASSSSSAVASSAVASTANGQRRALGEYLTAEMSAFLCGVDEADKCRLEKRIQMFRMCSEPFLRYFRRSKRVVRLDLRVPNNDELMPTVRRMLTDFGFGRNNDNIRVVLFVMDDEQAAAIDLEYYRLRTIRLLDICHDLDESMGQQIRAIRRFIYRTAQPNENILIYIRGLNDNVDNFSASKRINFLEYHTTYLDFYIHNRLKGQAPSSRCKMSFRAITSTSGEVCLFPESMSSRLCLRIGMTFGEKLSLSETDTRAPSQMSAESGAICGPSMPQFIGASSIAMVGGASGS